MGDFQMSARDSTGVCRLFKYYLYHLIGFPTYSSEQLREQLTELRLEDYETSAEEREEYDKISTEKRSNYCFALVCLLSSLYGLKNMYIPWITAAMLDFKDIDTDSPNVWQIGPNTYHVVCMDTNCTQFLRPHPVFTKDIRHFPVAPFCYPSIDSIYPPTTYVGPYSMLLHIMMGFMAITLGLSLPICLHLKPKSCNATMFILAPKLTSDLMSLRVKEIYRDYKKSFRNYQVSVEAKQKVRLVAAEFSESSTYQRKLLESELRLVYCECDASQGDCRSSCFGTIEGWKQYARYRMHAAGPNRLVASGDISHLCTVHCHHYYTDAV